MFEDKDKREEQGTEGYQNETGQNTGASQGAGASQGDSTYRMNFTNRDQDSGQQAQQGRQTYQQQQQSRQTYQQQGQQTYQQQRQYSYTPQGGQGGTDSGQSDKTTGRTRRFKHPFVTAVGCAVICGVIVGACVIGSFAIGRNMGTQTASSVTVTTNEEKLETSDNGAADTGSGAQTAPASSSTDEYTVAQIAEQCGSSVVAITNRSVQDVMTMFGYYEQESEGSGSGVIVGQTDDELLIVTNYHVVEDADELTVCFFDSEDAIYTSQVKGTDANNDLAVVAIPISDLPEELLSAISIATIGDSTQMQVGDGVVAIGNALGLGQSVTSGIISAVDRDVMIDDYTANLIQTDAAINPGNSGGALFNMKGELIGINSAKYASDEIEGMGFAIPTSTAQPIIESLMSMQTRTKLEENYGVLNITGTDVSSTDSQKYGMPVGVYVADVVEDGAAAEAGIQTGDIITGLDGLSVTGIEMLRDRLQYYAAGETVDVTVERNNGNGYEEMTMEVKLDNVADQESSISDDAGEAAEGYYGDGSEGYYNYGSGDINDFFGGYGYGDSGNGYGYSYGY